MLELLFRTIFICPEIRGATTLLCARFWLAASSDAKGFKG